MNLIVAQCIFVDILATSAHSMNSRIQQIGDINPLYELANTTNILPRNP